MLTQKPQAISGVSPDHETIVEELYPSIAATAIGDFMHRLLDSIPTRVWGLKISNVLFGPLVAPLAVLVYFWMKVFGARYVLTNRAVKIVRALGYQLYESVPLTQIASISVDPDSIQTFYQTGDIRLTGSGGQTLMLLRGVPRPERFRQVIQETCDAQRLVDASLARIKARH
jgi:hypothetical protein